MLECQIEPTVAAKKPSTRSFNSYIGKLSSIMPQSSLDILEGMNSWQVLRYRQNNGNAYYGGFSQRSSIALPRTLKDVRVYAITHLREDYPMLDDEQKVRNGVRAAARKLPTYVTLKDVKKRWGHGQEDVYPVTQFEKLWGDMTALGDISSAFIEVSRWRGQQLKEQGQLDGWLRDGSAAYIESLCAWS